MTVLHDDGQLRLYAPPQHQQSEWVPAVELFQDLKQYLQETGWKEAEEDTAMAPDLHVQGDAAAAVLRLHGGAPDYTGAAGWSGGGRSASVDTPAYGAPAGDVLGVGATVEVTNDEEGLRGCWFTGTVAARAPGHALVAYAELEDDAAPGEPLREWFPLPRGAPGASEAGGPPHDGRTRHMRPGFRLRPQPPAALCARGASQRPGERVDVFDEGGWWEGEVVAVLPAPTGKTAVKGHMTVLLVDGERDVPLADVRSSTVWVAGGEGGAAYGRWQLLGAPTAAVPTRSGKRVARGRAARTGAIARQVHVLGDSSDSPSTVSAPEESDDEDFVAEVVHKSSSEDTRSALEAVEEEAEDVADVLAESKGLGGRKLSGAVREGSAVTEPYQVPAGFDGAAELPGAALDSKPEAEATLPLAFLLRFLHLRAQVPAEEVETYQKGQHLRNQDALLSERVRAEMMHSHGERMRAHGLDEKWLLKVAKVEIRSKVIRAGCPAPSAVDMHAIADCVRARLQLKQEEPGAPARALADGAASGSQLEAVSKVPAAAPLARKRRAVGAVARRRQGKDLKAEEYASKLVTLSLLQVAWSGALAVRTADGGVRRFALLAAGVKSGRVWLWRAELPAEHSTGAAPTAAADRIALIGSVKAQSAWATALAWVHLPSAGAPGVHPEEGLAAVAAAAVTGEARDCSGDTLTLAVGGSDGSVRLLGGVVADLAARAPRQWREEGKVLVNNDAGRHAGGAPLLALLFQTLPPDGRSITCLDARLVTVTSGAQRLVLAAGKSAGVLAAWASAEMRGSSASYESGLGSAAAALAGFDGAARCWRLAGARLLPAPALRGLAGELTGAHHPGPSPPMSNKGGVAKPCLGVAVAAGGAAAAVVQHTANVGAEHTTQGQTHNKLYRARLRLLAGPALGDLGGAAAAAWKAVARLAAGPPAAEALWGAALALRRAAAASAAAVDEIGAGAAAAAAGLDDVSFAGGAAEGEGLLSQQIVQDILGELEAAIWAPAAGRAPEPDLAAAPASAWHLLQCACALRRMLLPPPPLPPRRGCLAPAAPQAQPPPGWEAALARNELALLQRHLLRTLRGPAPADWVALHAAGGAVWPALVDAAAEAGVPPEVPPPARERCAWGGAPAALSGSPLESAGVALADLQGCMARWPRCGATLRVCPPGPQWRCALCERQYAKPSTGSAHGGQAAPSCVFCGVVLGPALPVSRLAPVGLR
ncbi:hypothetical protein WJX81_003318 [Elliptochloris bilobata]|uniref:Agenet-like domain-containing protein n=1 Tax=Elliptochloris bilobata TaxID=381761 RepID=A0AAW1RCE4_9CHLO